MSGPSRVLQPVWKIRIRLSLCPQQIPIFYGRRGKCVLRQQKSLFLFLLPVDFCRVALPYADDLFKWLAFISTIETSGINPDPNRFCPYSADSTVIQLNCWLVGMVLGAQAESYHQRQLPLLPSRSSHYTLFTIPHVWYSPFYVSVLSTRSTRRHRWRAPPSTAAPCVYVCRLWEPLFILVGCTFKPNQSWGTRRKRERKERSPQSRTYSVKGSTRANTRNLCNTFCNPQ